MDWSSVKITGGKVGYWAPVNLDADGTPLTTHGERMVETAPGEWQDPVVAEMLKFLAAGTASVMDND